MNLPPDPTSRPRRAERDPARREQLTAARLAALRQQLRQLGYDHPTQAGYTLSSCPLCQRPIARHAVIVRAEAGHWCHLACVLPDVTSTGRRRRRP